MLLDRYQQLLKINQRFLKLFLCLPLYFARALRSRGFGWAPNPRVAMALSRLKPVVAQVKPILIFHPSGEAKNA